MESFKTMQDLFLGHTSNFIDDEEFLVLSELFEWKNPCFPYEDFSPFNLDEMTESECLSKFRFRKRYIPILADVLGIPETIGVNKDPVVTAWRVFAFPCRYADMIPRFAKPVPVNDVAFKSLEMVSHAFPLSGLRNLIWYGSISRTSRHISMS